jgi:hypothetical protein
MNFQTVVTNSNKKSSDVGEAAGGGVCSSSAHFAGNRVLKIKYFSIII